LPLASACQSLPSAFALTSDRRAALDRQITAALEPDELCGKPGQAPGHIHSSRIASRAKAHELAGARRLWAADQDVANRGSPKTWGT
jgi:hypothetical protein